MTDRVFCRINIDNMEYCTAHYKYMNLKRKFLIPFILLFLLAISQYFFPVQAYAQMQDDNSVMQMTTTPPMQSMSPTSGAMHTGSTDNSVMTGSGSSTMSMQDQHDILAGGTLFTQFQNHQKTCKNLQDGDFEKVGEYVMNKQMGEAKHMELMDLILLESNADGEKKAHIQIGRNATECIQPTPTQQPTSVMKPNASMVMSLSGGKELLGWIVTAVLLFIDVIALLVWLMKPKHKKEILAPEAPSTTTPSPSTPPAVTEDK